MKKYFLSIAIAVLAMGQLIVQSTEVPQIGSPAPAFTTMSTDGVINFPSDYGKSWKLIFSNPKDFTPVCSSEILELAYAKSSFDEMGAEFLVLSTDILEQHKSWKASLEEVLSQEQQQSIGRPGSDLYKLNWYMTFKKSK